MKIPMQSRMPMLLAVVLLPILIYARSLGNGFVHWDDGLLITDNAWIAGFTWTNIRHAFTSYDPELYIPLTLLSYQINYAIAGLSPWIYHLTNLVMHVINAVLVYGIAATLIGTGRGGTLQGGSRTAPTIAFATALLFAVHPLHTEAVAWASARKDVLSAMFLFGSILCFLRYRESGKKNWYGVSVLSFLLGLLSKVSILTLPLVLIAIDWLHGKASFRKSVRSTVPFFALSVIFGIVSIFGKITQGSFLLEKLLIGAKAAMFLLGKLLVPVHLAALYPYTRDIGIGNPDLLGSVIGVVMITGLTVWLTRWSRWPLFAWITFLLLLVPSFANMAKGRNESLDVYITTDRYAYAASLGPLLFAGLGFEWLRARARMIAWSAFTVVIVLFSMLAYRQSLTWRDSETFFLHAAAVSPDSYIAHQNLGGIRVKNGDIDGGLREYVATLKIRPDAVTYYNIGLILESRGDRETALEAYRQAVATSPLERDAWGRMAVLLREKGDVEGAREAEKEAQTD